MQTRRQNWKVRLRASLALIPLLAIWLSAPVALASSESNFCSMLCCVEEGHCCCSPRKPFVEGQADDSDRINDSEIESRCPKDCATQQSSSYKFPREPHPAAHEIEPKLSSIISSQSKFFIPDPLQLNPSQPRAPPFISL